MSRCCVVRLSLGSDPTARILAQFLSERGVKNDSAAHGPRENNNGQDLQVQQDGIENLGQRIVPILLGKL